MMSHSASQNLDHHTMEMANKWLERLGIDTEDIVNDAVGKIREVQRAMVIAAQRGLPFTVMFQTLWDLEEEDRGVQVSSK